MTPSAVKSYLSDRKVALLKDIAIHFDMEPDAIRGLMSHWIRKGRVRMYQDSGCQNGSCCGGCRGLSEKELYEWLQ